MGTWYENEKKKALEETEYKLHVAEMEKQFRPTLEQIKSTDEFESLIRNMSSQEQSIMRGLRADIDHERDLAAAFEKGFTTATPQNSYNAGWQKG